MLSLNIKNTAAAAAENRATVAMFYAPWCDYSKLMLPIFGEAARLVSGWEAQGLLAPQTLRMAHVNVDQEGELRSLQNVTTYPQLHVFTGKTKAAAQAAAHNTKLGSRRPMASPSELFQGSTATAADIACHAASAYGWASRQPFALLADSAATAAAAADSTKAGAKAAAKTNSATTFAHLALEADTALVAGAEAAALKPPPEEDEPGFGEVHKRVVAVLAVVPDDALEDSNSNSNSNKKNSSSSSSNSAAKAAGRRVAKVVGGGHVFVGSGSSAACAEAAAALLKDAKAPAAADGRETSPVVDASAEVAAKACAAFRVGPASGGVVVVHPSDGSVLSRPLPLPAAALEVADSADEAPKEPADSSSDNDDDKDVAAWLRVAVWPAVNRFSTSAEQGERIRKSGVSVSSISRMQSFLDLSLLLMHSPSSVRFLCNFLCNHTVSSFTLLLLFSQLGGHISSRASGEHPLPLGGRRRRLHVRRLQACSRGRRPGAAGRSALPLRQRRHRAAGGGVGESDPR